MTELSTIKERFRCEAKETLKRVSPDDVRRASDIIQARVMTEPAYVDAGAVFLYMPFGTEISTEALLDQSLLEEKRVFLPVFDKGEYWAAEHKRGDRLVKGKYGILEPERKMESELPAHLLIVLPGLAFDRQCHRLGRGGGYYDRMLRRLVLDGIDIVSIGLTYDCTLYEELPVGPLDFDVNIVVTENESVCRADITCKATE